MMPESDTLIRALYAAFGFAAGLYVGRTRNVARQALREAHRVEDHLHLPHGDEKPTKPVTRHPLNKVEVALLTLIFGFACVYGTVMVIQSSDLYDKADNRLDRAAVQRQTLEAEIRCVNKIERQNIDAQKARSEFNEQQATILLNLFDSFLDPDTDQAEARAALVAARQAVKDSLAVARDNPFPPIEDIRKCIEK